MSEPLFSLSMPARRTSPAVFSSPHSGSDYDPATIGRSRLSPRHLRSSEDAFVDELFSAAPQHGAPLLAARVPRASVDLNRSPDDLDPALIAGASRRFLNPRIAAGLGVIPRVVAEGRPIIDGKMTLAEAQRRITAYHRPYHAQLRALLEQSRGAFGQGLLFDCHSMPHDALAASARIRGQRPNIVLGDRFGVACERWVVDAATDIFTAEGFIVARNAPFAGGFITQSYGRPATGIHALQIEVDRALYMDESRIEKLPDFADVRRAIGAAVAGLTGIGRIELPMAAE